MTASSPLDDARERDAADPLSAFRERFEHPILPGGDRPATYFCGNSLGLLPREARRRFADELDDWGRLAVEGHFHGRRPWYGYHEPYAAPLARLVGAKEEEVVAMNTLTVNLHLLMVSFYRPSMERYRILIERGAFPSDRYAVASQAQHHGFDPADAIVQVGPRPGEHTIRIEDIEAEIANQGDRLALVLVGGVNYYTGQVFALDRIAHAAHAAGALCGFDLAHAAGNVPVELHASGADFAAWCGYKYLNGGPGCVAGAWVHERHHRDPDLVRFTGWWGNDPATRFEMRESFAPMPSAGAWQISNAQVFNMVALGASLELFDEAGFDALVARSRRLTGYLVERLASLPRERWAWITPEDPAQRGCQVSLLFPGRGRMLQQALLAEQILADYREPDVVRIAPVPLYNSFEDIERFVTVLSRVLAAGDAS